MRRTAVAQYNRIAWDRQVELGNRWTIPVDAETVAAARRGRWEILLTPSKPVPRTWFPDLEGAHVLCLASGGGQQGPVLAAAGATVTVLDSSPGQLDQDLRVAREHGVDLSAVEGDMADLSVFPDHFFDLIVHPVSNCFVPDVRPVWSEAFRVLRHGGVLLAGFNNPAVYLFDHDLADREGVLQVKYAIPYSDVTSLSDEERRRLTESGVPLEFGHTLEDQIGGQLGAGFALVGLYEDVRGTGEGDLLDTFMSPFIATRGLKL